MTRKLLFLFILLILGNGIRSLHAQVNVKDSTLQVSMVSVSAGAWLPMADLGDRFGPVFSAGPSFVFKTRGNWQFTLALDVFFGTDVKIRDSLFRQLSTSQGFIIGSGGTPSDVSVQMEGYGLSLRAGKLLPVIGNNPNSGLLLMAGAGYLIHRINISVLENTAPQLSGDYEKGYDRLTAGFTLSQFVGYQNLSNRRISNYYIGIELTEGFTRSMRDYDFDRMAPDSQSRLDLMIGIKAGWILPLYGRAPKDYYYY